MNVRTQQWAWVDGKWFREEEPAHPVRSRSLFYGAGCFETLAARGGRLLHPQKHLDRMKRGLQWLGVSADHHPDLTHLPESIGKLLRRNGLAERSASVRIQAALLGGRGYGHPEQTPVQLSMIAAAYESDSTPLRLHPVGIRTVPSVCRPAELKLSNCIHYMKARQEALRAGYEDALMCDVERRVAETPVANLFWEKSGEIHTPSEEGDLLPGIMRSILIRLIPDTGLTLREGCYGLADICEADRIWVTNSLTGIRPVSQVGDRRLDTGGEIHRRIEDALNRYIDEHQIPV